MSEEIEFASLLKSLEGIIRDQPDIATQIIASQIEPIKAHESAPQKPVAATNAQPDAHSATAEPVEHPSPAAKPKGILDHAQTVLDGVGLAGDAVVPGAGVVADGINAAISIGRAVKDPKNAGRHLFNAGVSAISMVPFVGDLAKGAKYAKPTAAAGKEAAHASTATKEALQKASESLRQSPTQQVDAIFNRVGQEQAESPQLANGEDALVEKNVSPITDQGLKVAGIFGAIVASGAAYVKTTDLLNKQVLEYHRHISGFNGELSAAYGRLEAGRMQREIQSAQDYGGSIAGLADSQNALEESLRDFNSPFVEMGTDIQTGLTTLANYAVQIVDFLEPFSELYPMIKEWLGVKGNSTTQE
jgi:hypothetical protein